MPDTQIDRNTRITLGLSGVMVVTLAGAMWQAHTISQKLEVADASMQGKLEAANNARAGENAVLSAKVDALTDRVQYVTDDLRAQISDLKAEVKEIAKRGP